MEQAIGMPVVGCFKQVSIITSNNAFTPARFPSIGLVLSALPVIPIDVFFFLRRFPTVFSRNLSPREWESEDGRRFEVTNVSVNTCQPAAKTSQRANARSHHFRTIFSRGSPARQLRSLNVRIQPHNIAIRGHNLRRFIVQTATYVGSAAPAFRTWAIPVQLVPGDHKVRRLFPS